MGAECALCEKRPKMGNQLKQRGKAKYLGGNGRKTTGISRRAFKPNLQTIRVQLEDTSARVRICCKCIRSGLVVKKVVRAPFSLPTE